MGGGHRHERTELTSHGPLHHVAPEAKVLATLGFIIAAVFTKREAMWAFAVYAALIIAVAVWARVPLTRLARRLTVEVPFVAFAVLMPFIGRAPKVDVGPLSLSREGLWTGWNVLAKGTLGVAATGVLSFTTAVPDLLRGLDRLRVPKLFTAIAGFMVRYAEVLRGESDRMRVARVSRGDNPRFLWQAKALASSSGLLFVRGYERGERVHLAMESRGFTGVMPELDTRRAGSSEWRLAAVPVVLAIAVAAVTWIIA
jgi:cobalt/nickel transport system permease protein